MRRIESLPARVVVLYVAALVGLAGGFWLFLNRPDWQPVRVEGLEASTEADEMVVSVRHARCNGDPRVRITAETREFVMIRAENNVRGDCDGISLLTPIDIELDADLRDRTIRIQQGPAGGTDTIRCAIEGRTPASGGCGVLRAN